jgi:hypothetical protein
LGYFWHRFLFSAQVTWTMSLLFVLPHVTGVTVTQYHIIGEMGGSWIFLPRWASNCDSPDLCSPSS